MVYAKRQITHLPGMIALMLLIPLVAVSFLASSPQVLASGKEFFQQHNLVSDIPGKAQVTDTNLQNPWGIAFGPTTPFWIADNAAGVSTLYNGQGQPIPLVVTIPPPKGGTGPAAPTGIVFNDTDDFVVTEAGKSAPARFIFSTEDGTLSGWSPNVDRAKAIVVVDKSDGGKGAVYKGLARGNDEGRDLLFATNFRAGVVDVFDANFHWKRSFTDRKVPAGYAPFGISNIGGLLYVTFALQNAEKHDDVKGAGHGFVDVFNTDGHLVRRLVSRGVLNSPWGLALAPSNFGRFSHALLVGNFGNGRINAFNTHTGAFIGTLRDEQGHPIVNDGLWALTFGNGTQAGALDTLFFTAGINDEKDGLFGSITFK